MLHYLSLACALCIVPFLLFLFCFFLSFASSRLSFVDGSLIFSCPVDHVPDWQPRIILLGMVEVCSVNVKNTHTHTHTLIPPPEDQCEWHRMTRMTGPDCVVRCNLINTHTHTHTNYQFECYQLARDSF